MKKIRKHRNNKGFSFIEVLLAVVILGLVATPILQMFYTSYRITAKSKVSLAAADLSQTVMEYISGSSYENYVSTADNSLMKQGLKEYYFINHTPTIVPGGPTAGGGVDFSVVNRVVYKNVDYEGYHFDVTITVEEPADTSGEYFVYKFLVTIKGTDGLFYNEARTEVVNRY